jgi:epoxyqueuosine reductase
LIENIYEKVKEELNSNDFEVNILPIKVLGKIKAQYEQYYEDNVIHHDLRKRYFSKFQFDSSIVLPNAKSIFLVATYSPTWKIKFEWNGKIISTFVPPTYLFGKKSDEEALRIMSSILNPEGYTIEKAYVPYKLLSVYSGLVKYGRNNITYASRFGSYHRLAGYVSNLPSPQENINELILMEECRNCSACQKNCPTNAITNERFIIKAERCLTYHNEMESEIEFPEWIDPSWHNCLVGCMRCQWVCPVNKRVLKKFKEGPTFTHKETKEILKTYSFEYLSPELASKLEDIDIKYFYEVISRNLKALIKN